MRICGFACECWPFAYAPRPVTSYSQLREYVRICTYNIYISYRYIERKSISDGRRGAVAENTWYRMIGNLRRHP